MSSLPLYVALLLLVCIHCYSVLLLLRMAIVAIVAIVKDGSINYWDLLWISCICDYICDYICYI